MNINCLSLGICILMVSCASPSSPTKLPEDPLGLTIKQRDFALVAGNLKIEIGDITGGQVLLTIWDGNDAVIVNTRSVIAGDVIEFDYKEHKYYLTVVRLKNFLIGDDFGEFELSSTPPAERRTSEDCKVIHFDYDSDTNRGVISVETYGEGIECRKWLVKNIGAICSSKNVTLKAGEESAKGGYYRILGEKIENDVLTVHFEAVW
ncbi:MAG: hypothetical protein V1789_06270 [PVC group bacterium]